MPQGTQGPEPPPFIHSQVPGGEGTCMRVSVHSVQSLLLGPPHELHDPSHSIVGATGGPLSQKGELSGQSRQLSAVSHPPEHEKVKQSSPLLL